MASSRPIILGDRTVLVGRMTLGTLRRVPEAFAIAESVDLKNPKMPTPAQFAAMMSVLFDGIESGSPGLFTRETFDALIDGLDLVDGIKQVADGIKAMTTTTRKATDDPLALSGNSNSSESERLPASSD